MVSAKLMSSMPALASLVSLVLRVRPAKSLNWASRVTFRALSSAVLIVPSLLVSPNVGSALKLMPAAPSLPMSMLRLFKVSGLPSKSPEMATASTPNFCKSLRLVDRWVPWPSTSALVISKLMRFCASMLNWFTLKLPEPKSTDKPKLDCAILLKAASLPSKLRSSASVFTCKLMPSMPAASSLLSFVPSSKSFSWLNCASSVTFRPRSSAALMVPSLLASPKPGKFAKLMPPAPLMAPVPKSKLMLFNVAASPSKSPLIATASTPNF